MKFNRSKPITKQIGIGRTVFDDLKKHPICRSMNDPLKEGTIDPRDMDVQVWINPHNQYCFESMWCTPEILEEWMEGKGPMVKGDTNEEKKKYWDLAVFEEEKGYNGRFWIRYMWKWFDKFTTDFEPHKHSGYGMNNQIKTPIKMRSRRLPDHLEEDIRQEKIIMDMYAPYVNELVREMEYREYGQLKNEYDKEFFGIKRTLYCMGIGYMGASNTPEEIRNLNWVTDIVYAKALYLFLKKEGKVHLPDFAWHAKTKEEKEAQFAKEMEI